jgi:hypothetical protein
MKIATKYDVLQRVIIVPLNVQATVVAISFNGASIYYEVEYWWEGDKRRDFVRSCDLTELKRNRK